MIQEKKKPPFVLPVADLAGMAALILAVVLLGTLTMHDSLEKKRLLREECAGLSQRLDLAEPLSDALREAETLLSAAKDQATSVTLQFAGRKGMGALFDSLAADASQTGMIVNSIQPGTIQEYAGSGYLEMRVTISARGSVEAFHSYLHFLTHRAGRLVTLESLSVKAANDPRNCDANLVVTLWAEPEAESPPTSSETRDDT